jgi:hypothetical protein
MKFKTILKKLSLKNSKSLSLERFKFDDNSMFFLFKKKIET